MNKGQILWFKKTTSTNDVALSLAKRGFPQGTVIVSDFQTKGRGRQGRTWESQQGKDLLFSIIFKSCGSFLQDKISLLASVAVANVLKKKFNITTFLRWPNDLLFENKKICGVLVEGSPDDEYFVVGIGINVNSKKNELPESATSLSLIKKTHLERRTLLVNIVDSCDTLYRESKYKSDIIIKEATLLCETLGRSATIKEKKKRFEGYCIGLNTDGSLLVRLDSGMQKTIRSAEVMVIK
ncbi:biotin--[acetyl-CoA-carboxylase] ligase [bacterium Unc6]|nr:biotin--[acetyl-CoA-carboxylase] ligase [bacterium Unc6]